MATFYKCLVTKSQISTFNSPADLGGSFSSVTWAENKIPIGVSLTNSNSNTTYCSPDFVIDGYFLKLERARTDQYQLHNFSAYDTINYNFGQGN